MSGPSRRMLALAFAVSTLLLVMLPRSAAAAPSDGAAAPSRGAAVPSGGAAASASVTTTPPAAPMTTASNDPGSACSLPGLVPADGTRCPGNGRLRRQILGIPNPLLNLNPGQALTTVAGGAFKTVALAVIVGWVASSAESALKDTAKVIGNSTKPELTSGWFSASYWRIAAIAALLTLPFLCAAAIHALVRSDLALLTRAAFGYLPLSLLAVGIASQLTMLLLSSVDEMSSIVASASAHSDGVFLAHTAVGAIAASISGGDPFVAFLAAIITVAAALTLWVELLVRDAAVYVIVLMLPLFFAAMVWPARRTLAIRAIETLIALILSKFAIVAVLALGGVALGHSSIPGPTTMLMGATLVMLAAFSPWALLRMLPLQEVASAAAGGLSQGLRQSGMTATRPAFGVADGAAALGADGAEWLRPRLASGVRSLLDGSRYGDAHRSAALSEPNVPADAVDAPGTEREVAPVAAEAMDGALGGAGHLTDADDGGAAGDRSWTQPSAGTPGVGGAAGASGAPRAGGDDAGGRGARAPDRSGRVSGEPVAGAQSAHAVDAAADTAGGGATIRRGPDGETFPYVFGPDDPIIVIGDELRMLANHAAANARGDASGSTPDAPGAAPGEAIVEPPPLPGEDPIGPPARDPVGPRSTQPPAPDREPPADGPDGDRE